MSLIHWWPLDGDLKDKITSNTLIEGYSGFSWTNDGKIGTAINVYPMDWDDEGLALLKTPYQNELTNNEFSISMWVKFTSLYWDYTQYA
jgi:hypothetical protein